MTAEEFEQLRSEQESAARAEGAEAEAGSEAGPSSSGSTPRQGQRQQKQQQRQQRRLSLGRDLLKGDFGEMVGSTILQVGGSLCIGWLVGHRVHDDVCLSI